MPPTIHVSHRIESYPGLHQLLCSLRSRELACTTVFSGHSVFLAIAQPSPYSAREVENTLAEMALAELDEFEKVDDVYRWKKSYRFSKSKS